MVDVAVVGAGVVGLANAWAAARRGLSVAVFERSARAEGASVRNFGMVWPVGQPAGADSARALKSREYWLKLRDEAGLWASECGSLHLARRPDELAVIEEFTHTAPGAGIACELVTADEACRASPAVKREGLLGALWSPSELCVDPRQAIALIPRYLAERYGVRFHFDTPVSRIEPGRLETATGEPVMFRRAVVCGGTDVKTLLPQAFADSGVVPCKLQMMRTAAQPGGWRMGPHLAGGLTLTHYPSFRDCPTLAALKTRLAEEMPEYVANGIHVMASQNGLGEVVIGDTHHYGDAITPFENPRLDSLVLDYLSEFAEFPAPEVAARWTGVYPKHPSRPHFVAEPFPGVHVVTALGGAGMTLAFGLTEELWTQWHDGVAA